MPMPCKFGQRKEHAGCFAAHVSTGASGAYILAVASAQHCARTACSGAGRAVWRVRAPCSSRPRVGAYSRKNSEPWAWPNSAPPGSTSKQTLGSGCWLANGRQGLPGSCLVQIDFEIQANEMTGKEQKPEVDDGAAAVASDAPQLGRGRGFLQTQPARKLDIGFADGERLLDLA